MKLSLILGYIDPSSGTLLLQVLFATLLGGLAFFSRIKATLLGLVSRGPKPTCEEIAETSPAEDGHEARRAA